MNNEHNLLHGIKVVSLAVNVPGPAAAARLRGLGAEIVKVEPPAGDPLARISHPWYQAMAAGQQIVTLDLKDKDGRAALEPLLRDSDLLITSMRSAALARLSLTQAEVQERHPRLCQVAIIGFKAPADDIAGHDLTYQATAGLLSPPHLP
ncbi:MAG TPA: CoA transferase, partial [Pyrinomonadaceae bacterium]|nr:CoA transferase [Pyrinomonadaceae bacterium]